MKTYKCDKGCCSIHIHAYKKNEVCPHRRNYKKAGVFIYNPDEKRVLLVQSRGNLWGPPKGTLEFNENETQCAVREVLEETGISIKPHLFRKATVIKNRATYFYMESDIKPVTIQKNNDNDANGITWIKINCLEKCIKDGRIVLNQHCKVVFERFMNKIFPKSGFIIICRKRKK